MQEMGLALEEELFSLVGAFLSEKKNEFPWAKQEREEASDGEL